MKQFLKEWFLPALGIFVFFFIANFIINDDKTYVVTREDLLLKKELKKQIELNVNLLDRLISMKDYQLQIEDGKTLVFTRNELIGIIPYDPESVLDKLIDMDLKNAAKHNKDPSKYQSNKNNLNISAR